MALIEGMNAEGKIRRRNNDRINHHPSGMEFLETRRPKRRRNFDFIIGTVAKGEAPWDF
jgi:hypothetical protein